MATECDANGRCRSSERSTRIGNETCRSDGAAVHSPGGSSKLAMTRQESCHGLARRGFKCAYFKGPGLQKHHQHSTKRPQRQERKKIWAGEGKKLRILGGPAEGGPWEGSGMGP